MRMPATQDLEYEVVVTDVVDNDSFLRDDATGEGRYGIYEDLLLRKEVGNRLFHYGDNHRASLSYSKVVER